MKRTCTLFKGSTLFFGMALMANFVKAQTTVKTSLTVWDGMFVAGYVGNGAYINCGGPSVKWTMKPFSIAVGLFPAVRIKDDKQPAGAKTNSAVTPSTGVGITSAYKHLVFQIPLFYDAKTASSNGKWNLGVGVGYKF